MSFDSNFEYYVGLFMANKTMSERKPTVPNPFRLHTIERNGERDYSAFAQRRGDSNTLAQNDSIDEHGLRNITRTLPRAPSLSLSRKNGDRYYSSSKTRASTPNRNIAANKPNVSTKNARPPRLTLTRKKGNRIYSSFAGSRDSDATNNKSQSPLRPLGPPNLRLSQIHGDRVYSSFGGDVFDKAEPRLNHRSMFHLNNLHPPKLTLTEKLGERHYSLFAPNLSKPYDPSLVRGKNTNIGPPRLRLLEKHGERIYSTSVPTHRGIFAVQSWNESRHLSLTVPEPFHLSSSPAKFANRALEGKKAKFQFKALPLPDYWTKSALPDHMKGHNVKTTVPIPYNLSVTNRKARRGRSHSPRRARSHSPGSARRHYWYENSPANMYGGHYHSQREISSRRNKKMARKKTQVPKKLRLNKRQKSVKSKHRFAMKHQGKVIKNTQSSTKNISVNPNINASRAAREKYLLKVAAEVAQLREEWQRYKDEAQRVSDEIAHANSERRKILNELSTSSDKEGANIDTLQKQLAKLDTIVESKLDLLVKYQEMLKENERKQRVASKSYKQKSNDGKEAFMKERQPVLIHGRQRSIRRVLSFKKKKTSTKIVHTIQSDEGEHVKQRERRDNNDEIDFNSSRSKENETKTACNRVSKESLQMNKNIENIERNMSRLNKKVEQIGKRSEEGHATMDKKDNHGKSLNSSLSKGSVDEDSARDDERIDMEQRAASLNDSVSNVCVMDARDTDEEISSQRGVDGRHNDVWDKAEGDLSQKFTSSAVREIRPKGDFGDDFAGSSLTTMFRGGWKRALRQEHLGNNSTSSLLKQEDHKGQNVSSIPKMAKE